MSDKTEYHQMYGGNTVIFDFPASSLKIDLLIVSGITETTQTVFALARLYLMRLRKNLRLTL